MDVAESLLQKIVRRLLEVSRPDRIILFGSAARGEMTRDSDIDLLVLEPSPEKPRQESVRLRNALRGLGYPEVELPGLREKTPVVLSLPPRRARPRCPSTCPAGNARPTARSG
jgi:predicted nucleotidyltransferase